jgi:4-hydroxy-2-oxoheptanedioate aldolase
MVDGEHGLITDEHYYNVRPAGLLGPPAGQKTSQAEIRKICTHVASCGASPIIRIPVDAEWMIKRALDAGAHGVMTPMCHTAVRPALLLASCPNPAERIA